MNFFRVRILRSFLLIFNIYNYILHHVMDGRVVGGSFNVEFVYCHLNMSRPSLYTHHLQKVNRSDFITFNSHWLSSKRRLLLKSNSPFFLLDSGSCQLLSRPRTEISKCHHTVIGPLHAGTGNSTLPVALIARTTADILTATQER